MPRKIGRVIGVGDRMWFRCDECGEGVRAVTSVSDTRAVCDECLKRSA